MTPAENSLFNEIINAQKRLTDLRFEYWKKFEVFKPVWWVLLFLTIAPWVIWLKLIDRKRFFSISFVGFLVMIISVELDIIGNELSLWQYPHKLIMFGPRLLTADFSMLPVLYMAVYQYFPRWKSYLIFSLLLALFISFIGEPIFVLLGIYEKLVWKYWYSLPTYFCISIFVKWLTDKLKMKLSNA